MIEIIIQNDEANEQEGNNIDNDAPKTQEIENN
jgi:hypothetical protein